eukprot:5587983-Prymnesium_polylepis.1
MSDFPADTRGAHRGGRTEVDTQPAYSIVCNPCPTRVVVPIHCQARVLPSLFVIRRHRCAVCDIRAGHTGLAEYRTGSDGKCQSSHLARPGARLLVHVA